MSSVRVSESRCGCKTEKKKEQEKRKITFVFFFLNLSFQRAMCCGRVASAKVDRQVIKGKKSWVALTKISLIQATQSWTTVAATVFKSAGTWEERRVKMVSE